MEDFGFWDVIVSIFWFTLLLAWISVLMSILGDIFGDRELSGGAKALWTAFVVLLPWLGVLCYIVARGNSMNERTRQARLNQEAHMRAFVQEAAGRPASISDQLKELVELRESGTISPAEYEQAKAKVLT